MADAGKDFDQYLYEIKHKTPGEHAFFHGYRNDSVTSKSPPAQVISSQYTSPQGGIPPTNAGFFPGTPSPLPQGMYDGLQIQNAGLPRQQAPFTQYTYSDNTRGQQFPQAPHDPNISPSPQVVYAQDTGMGMRNEFNLCPPPVTPSRRLSQTSLRGPATGYSGGQRADESDSDD